MIAALHAIPHGFEVHASYPLSSFLAPSLPPSLPHLPSSPASPSLAPRAWHMQAKSASCRIRMRGFSIALSRAASVV